MNERIKQLAETALEYAKKNQSADIPQHWFRLYNEKFAELIVRECASKVDWILAEGGKTQGDLIKQHFGVAE